MKSYKGFNKDMTCRGFQFKEGETYTEETAVACEKGFHACENPLDVLSYYPPATSVYHEVEQSGTLHRSSDDTKVASTEIKIGAEISIVGLVKAQFEYVRSHITNENNAEPGNAATAGECGAATAGECGAATAGECGAATAGNYGAATAGNYGAATAGEYGAATSRGPSAVGKEGAALARTHNAKVKGGLGSVLVCVVEFSDSYKIKDWKAGVVDGKTLMPDVWYTVKNGEFVEVRDD